MQVFEVSYNGCIHELVEAANAQDAAEGFAMDARAEGHDIRAADIDVR